MTDTLVRWTNTALGALALSAAAAQAQAAPVTARFSGTVIGHDYGFLDPAVVAYDDDNPVGTAVSWALSFDDAFLGQPWPDVGWGPFAAMGTMQVGSVRYMLGDFNFFSITWEPDFTTIRYYNPQVPGTASGPVASDGADFLGLFINWGTDLSLQGSPTIGYGYSRGTITSYGYLITTGTYSVDRGGSVPEPTTAWLALTALAWMVRRRRA